MSEPIDYSLSNSQLYPSALLSKQAYKLFITIPHTDLSVDSAISSFKTYKQIVYCKVAQEHHEDNDTHLHIFLSFKHQVKYATIFNLLKTMLVGKRLQGTINFQVPTSSEAVCRYIDKEGNTSEFGERPSKIGNSGRQKDDGYREAIIASKIGNIEEAVNILLEHQPRDMMINGEAIQENLKKLNQTREKFPVPVFNNDNTTLKPWQSQLLEMVQSVPKARRIIWVVGEPESGKSFMFNYLSNLDNYKYGLYNAGQCVSMDNLVYGYDEEGVIAWDFPMNYDWSTMETHTSNIIEKFSDFGQSVSSKKYKGHTKLIRGHCVVFSNREPLDGLQHRDVVIIRAKKDVKVKPVKVKVINGEKESNVVEVEVKVPEEHDLVKVVKVSHQSTQLEEYEDDDPIFGDCKIDSVPLPSQVAIDALLKRLEVLLHYDMNDAEQRLIKHRLIELGYKG